MSGLQVWVNLDREPHPIGFVAPTMSSEMAIVQIAATVSPELLRFHDLVSEHTTEILRRKAELVELELRGYYGEAWWTLRTSNTHLTTG